jgi:hypothetical protein
VAIANGNQMEVLRSVDEGQNWGIVYSAPVGSYSISDLMVDGQGNVFFIVPFDTPLSPSSTDREKKLCF